MRPGFSIIRIVDARRTCGRWIASFLLTSLIYSTPQTLFAEALREKGQAAPLKSVTPEAVQETFLKGKSLYDAGDVEAALQVWKTLDPHLGPYPSVRKVIEYLKARSTEPVAESRVEMTAALEQAADQMQARREESARAREAVLPAGKSRMDYIRETFEKGRLAASEGDWAAAIQQWDLLAKYLDESAPERQLIEALKRDYFTAEKLQAETRQTLAASKEKIKAPAGLAQALEEAKAKLRAQAAQISSEAAVTSKARAEREAWVDATLVRARASYEEGRIEPAILEWEKALPYLEDEIELREKIKTLRENLRTLSEVRSQSDSASAEAFGRIKVPLGDRLSAEIARATDILRTREGRSIEQQQNLKKSLAEREEWIAVQFEKGKQLLNDERIADALAQWEPILPNVEGGEDLRAAFDRVRAEIQKAKAAEESAAKQEKAIRLKAPSELEGLIEKAAKNLVDQKNQSESLRQAAEEKSLKRQKEVSQAFDKGKDLYIQGKYWEAASAWKTMLPLVEESAQIEKWISQFEAAYRDYLDSKAEADRLSDEKARKFSAPADVLKLLMQAQKDVEAQTASLVAERASMEKGVSEHRAWANEVFQKGKMLYQQDRPDLAIQEWEKLLSHLEESAPERALILELGKQRAAAQSAAEQIKALNESGKGRIQAPSDLKLALESAIDVSRAKQREAELERQAVERSINERRDAMLEILQTGRDAFDGGRAEEALAEWKKLLQYVDSRTKLDQTLKEAEDAFKQQADAKQKLADAKARGGTRFEPPQELAAEIAQAAERMNTAAAQARTEKSNLEKDYAARRQWLDQTFQAGQQHYAAGRLEAAVDEWLKLAPYLPEESGLPARLAQLKTAKEESIRARKEAVEAVAQQYKGLRVEPQMETFLTDISKDLKTQSIQSAKDRQAALDVLSNNQKKSDLILKEGKALYDAGDLGGALGVWAGLIPYLDENSKMRLILKDLNQHYGELNQARKAAQSAQAAVSAGVELPSDLPKLTEEAKNRLASQMQAASSEIQKFKLTRTEREKKAAQTYELAKTKLWSGDIAGAVAAWKSIAAEVEGLPAVVQTLEAELALTQKTKADAASSAARASDKLAPPAEFAKEVEAARQKIRLDVDNLLNQKAKSEGDLALRQQALNDTFEKGKALYWSGKVGEAIENWKLVAAAVSDEASVKSFEELLKAHGRLKDAQTHFQSASAAASGKLAAPAELSKLVNIALAKTNAEILSIQSEKVKMVEDLAARQLRAEEAFQKGSSAAAAGKYDEAVAQWRLLEPLLDGQSGLSASLDELEKAILEARKARQDTDAYAAGEFKAIRFGHSAEITKLVSQAQTQLKKQSADAQKRKIEMEKTFADRQAWVEATFQKGKTLFENGQYVEAFEFWKSLIPYLEDGPRTSAMLEEFSHLQLETAKIVADAADAESKKDARFASPAELTALLAQGTEKVKAAQFDARTRIERVEQALSDRRVAIQKAFDAGKAALEKGSVTTALDEWAKMLPMVEQEDKVRAALDAVRLSHQSAVEAKQNADKAEAKKDALLPVPAELTAVLESVISKMKKETLLADAQREKMEKTLADRQLFVQKIYTAGRALYDDGKIREAIDLWKTIGPYVENEAELDNLLVKAGQAYEGFVGAKAASHQAVLKQSSKLPAPPELLAMIDTAIAKLKQDDFDSRGKTFEIEKSIADRREWISSTFKKGQSLYIEGRIAEAVAEWNTILPYLDDGLDVKAKLVEIDKNAILAEKSRRILQDSLDKAKLQFHSPQELSDLLTKANEELKNQMFTASAEKMKAEQTLADRQKWMNQTFELGRSFYAEGKVGEALSEWSKLKPYLDSQPAIGEMMAALQKTYDSLQQAKKAAVEATAEDYKGLKLTYSDQMAKVLQEAVQKLKDETLALREKLDKTHEALTERKEWSVTTFNKGKVLFDDARYAEALEQWQRLLPYIENDSQVKTLIESYQKSYAEWADRSGAIGELQSRSEKPVQLAQPETMAVTLKDAADKMKAQAEAAAARASDLETQMAERKRWIEHTFQKGKTFFDQGHYGDAVSEWGVLGPYLSEHPEVREQIEEAKRSYIQYKKADQILQNTDAKKAGLLPLPENAVLPPKVTEPAAEIESPSAPVEPQPEPESAPAQKTAETKADAAESAPALLSGEVVSVDRSVSVFHVKIFADASEISLHFDGATQFDGASGASPESLQKGASVDVRADGNNRASYIYIY